MRHRHRPLPFAAAALALATAFACGPSLPPAADAPDPEEEVRIGYGSMDRDDLTGSVSSLTANDLEHQRVSRVEDLLAGRVAGVMVSSRADGSVSIRIRGIRSIMGSNEPLVVIDGMPVNAFSASHALMGLAPADVARIDVLKDAGSTAAYGVRGANGVILITTKRAGDR